MSTNKNFNHRPGSYNLAENISNKILEENKNSNPTSSHRQRLSPGYPKAPTTIV